MARERRPAEELSIEELEAILARKRVEARLERVRRFRRSGRALRLQSEPDPTPEIVPAEGGGFGPERPSEVQDGSGRKNTFKRGVNRLLFIVEVSAVVALAFVLFSGFDALRSLNQEVAEARAGRAPSPTPLITAVVLPSGHTPPTSPGGARPNDDEIPEHLRPLVQSLPAPAIPTPGPSQAQSIFIPALWESGAPVVQGDGWEQLKKGVGQHIGSVNPGQAGNLVLSAHNDIFGELFRDLDKLNPGDEVIVTTATREFLYKITGFKIVEPTEVSVMEPTAKPTITLISCYPYLVDSQRIVVFGELVEG